MYKCEYLLLDDGLPVGCMNCDNCTKSCCVDCPFLRLDGSRKGSTVRVLSK